MKIHVTEADLPNLVSASYRDFHARGLDYICLRRTPDHTVKVYMLNGDVTRMPEVVNPHDHRYSFSTTVLCGEMVDYEYMVTEDGVVHQQFDYMTPLNGGSGFEFARECRLTKTEGVLVMPGQQIFRQHDEIHTIRMLQDQTFLLLQQYEDTVDLDEPTRCWVPSGYPSPDTSGLYSRFSEGELTDRLQKLQNLLRVGGVNLVLS